MDKIIFTLSTPIILSVARAFHMIVSKLGKPKSRRMPVSGSDTVTTCVAGKAVDMFVIRELNTLHT
jgi:hypothetical protein